MAPIFYGLWFRLTCRDNSRKFRGEHESPTFEATGMFDALVQNSSKNTGCLMFMYKGQS